MTEFVYFLKRFFVTLRTLPQIFFFKLFVRPQKNISYAFLRLDNIGDFILWRNWAYSITRVLGGEKCAMICNNSSSSLAQSMGFGHVIGVDPTKFTSNFKYRNEVLKNISNIQFDTLITVNPNRSISYEDSLSFLTNANVKIAFTGRSLNRTTYETYLIDNFIYTDLCTFDSDRNFIQYAYKVMYNFLQDKIPELPDIDSNQVVKHNQRQSHKTELSNYFLVAPGASNNKRTWTEKKFSQLLDRISIISSKKAILVGSESDSIIVSKIISECKIAVPVDYSGETDLINLEELVARASFVISNESLCTHLCRANSIPNITILGGGHFGIFTDINFSGLLKADGTLEPKYVYSEMNCFGCNWKCDKPISNNTYKCIDNISCDRVFDTVVKLGLLNIV